MWAGHPDGFLQVNPMWAGHPDGFLQVNPMWAGHPDGFLKVNPMWAGHPDGFLQVKKRYRRGIFITTGKKRKKKDTIVNIQFVLVQLELKLIQIR